MQMQRCGKSNIEVSAISIGCWSFGGRESDYWGSQDQEQVEAVVHSALDHGINFFDTAEGYNDGRSEQSLGQALAGLRDRAAIATKVSPDNTQPQTLSQHCEASLRRLQTDYLDIYYVHWPIAGDWAEDAFATLIDLQAEGKIRSIGLSNHGVQQMEDVLATGAQIELNQLHYNLLSRAIEVEIMPMCLRENIGVVAYMPLLQGLLTGKYETVEDIPAPRRRSRHFRSRDDARHGEPGAEQAVFDALAELRTIAQEKSISMTHLALAWVMAKPGVTSVLVGARSPEQVSQNVAAAEADMTPELVQRLDELGQPVFDALGANADYWDSQANSRTR